MEDNRQKSHCESQWLVSIEVTAQRALKVCNQKWPVAHKPIYSQWRPDEAEPQTSTPFSLIGGKSTKIIPLVKRDTHHHLTFGILVLTGMEAT